MVILIDERQYATTEMMGLLSNRDRDWFNPAVDDAPLKGFLGGDLDMKGSFSPPRGLSGMRTT